MHLHFVTLLFLPFVLAQTTQHLPRNYHHDKHVLPLPFRAHKHKPAAPPHYAHSRVNYLGKRDVLSDLFCQIGILSSCPTDTTDPTTGVDTNSDPNNCGSLGTVCPATLPNGVGTTSCQSGSCIASCPAGFTPTSSGCVDTQSDPSNCGAVGETCTPSVGEEAVVCFRGGCVATACEAGYTLESGSCERPTQTSECPSGYTYDPALGTCRANSTLPSCDDTDGTCASSDSYPSPTASSDPSTNPAPTTTDPGAPITGASASARARLRAKRDALPSTPRTLCPTGLIACPIASSASLLAVQPAALSSSPFSSPSLSLPFDPSTTSGFECLDPLSTLESCGGCAALGTGTDCQRIPHASSVGCGEGRCAVLSCEEGYRVSADALRCLRRSHRYRRGKKYGH
ncbi:hypothetical protein JCM10207_000741 [Rhodosporidiobolus poonsookiae]